MGPRTASAIASPNIALIKYWGNRDEALRLPSNGSISMTMGGLECQVTVAFEAGLQADVLVVNGAQDSPAATDRVSHHLDLIRERAGLRMPAHVESTTNFPARAGLASSAAAFAALTLAGSAAAGLALAPRELSRLARRGSGSACRSIFGGYVEWHSAEDDAGSFAEPLASAEHWRLVDVVAVVSSDPKAVGSSEGHRLAASSALQAARVAEAPRRLDHCRKAILQRDFDRLAAVCELDSNLMHAVMLTSDPPLIYWLPATLAVMRTVVELRRSGVPVCYTVDAGPNVHCLTPFEAQATVAERIRAVEGVHQLLLAHPGSPAALA